MKITNIIIEKGPEFKDSTWQLFAQENRISESEFKVQYRCTIVTDNGNFSANGYSEEEAEKKAVEAMKREAASLIDEAYFAYRGHEGIA